MIPRATEKLSKKETDELIYFVIRWAWNNQMVALTDSERLSAIKYYPLISRLADDWGLKED